MAAKSPDVQPMRQRKVLTPDRFHVVLDVQNGRLNGEGTVEVCFVGAW
jgi:hypothetical protein